MGINRTNAATPWSYFNGTLAATTISNGHPYAHWSWYHPSFALNTGYNCILAWWVVQQGTSCNLLAGMVLGMGRATPVHSLIL